MNERTILPAHIRIRNPGRLCVATALRVIALDDRHLNEFNLVTSKEVAE